MKKHTQSMNVLTFDFGEYVKWQRGTRLYFFGKVVDRQNWYYIISLLWVGKGDCEILWEKCDGQLVCVLPYRMTKVRVNYT